MENESTPVPPPAPAPVPPALRGGPAAVPPPLIQPPRAPRRSNLGAWMLAALVLGGLLLLVVGALVLSQMTQGLTASRRHFGPTVQQLQEFMVEDNSSRHKIAIIDVLGIISGDAWDPSGRNLVQLVRDQLSLAALDPRVRAVVLNLDTPGGEVLASDEISQAIATFQNECRKPVVASMQSLAASGGYYAAAPCRWIVANEMTITGSIGVIMHGYNYRGLLNKVGVRPEVYKSGRFKDMLSSDKEASEVTPEEKQMIQGLIDETYARFKSVVREGRTAAAEANEGEGRPLVENWEEYADGRIFSGKLAYDYGFVDELGNFRTAVERAQSLADIPDANLVRYQRPFDLASLFRLLGSSEESRAVKLDLGVDLPRLQAGRLYFICPTTLP